MIGEVRYRKTIRVLDEWVDDAIRWELMEVVETSDDGRIFTHYVTDNLRNSTDGTESTVTAATVDRLAYLVREREATRNVCDPPPGPTEEG